MTLENGGINSADLNLKGAADDVNGKQDPNQRRAT